MFSCLIRKIFLNHCIMLTCMLFHVLLIGIKDIDIQSDLIQNKPQVFISDEKCTIQQKAELPAGPKHVKKVVLDNGLTVLICESHVIPKVSCQIWYNVGSKDELIGEKGLAHLLEHMV